jgi:hypothetical protein
VHLIMSAFARHGSLGSFVLALRVPTSLTPPASTLIPYSPGNKNGNHFV